MKVCLINPPVSCFAEDRRSVSSSSFFGALPLGLLYVAAAIRHAAHSVHVIDCVRNASAKISSFGREHVYGIELQELGATLRRLSPDVIGITCQFTANANNLLRTANVARTACPEALVVAGGPHATVCDRDVLLACFAIDVVVRGEGERTFCHLLGAMENHTDWNGLPGISFRRNGTVLRNPDAMPVEPLDELQFPAYDLVDMDAYLGRRGPAIQGRLGAAGAAMPMITSRGCPFDCTFCSVRLTMTRKWRGHSPEYFARHVRFLKDRYNVERFRFEDDSILTDKHRFRAMLELLVEQRLHIHWDTPNGVVASHLDEEIVGLMKAAGCLRTAIGVESGNQRVLKQIVRKKLDLKTVELVAATCRKHRLPCYAFFVIGFPGETRSDIDDTVRFALSLAKKHKLEVSGAMTATPLFGTELYKKCRDEGLFARPPTPENFYHATGKEGIGMIRTSEFTPEYLQTVNRRFTMKAYRIILLRALTHPHQFVELARNVCSSRRGWLYLKRLAGRSSSSSPS